MNYFTGGKRRDRQSEDASVRNVPISDRLLVVDMLYTRVYHVQRVRRRFKFVAGQLVRSDGQKLLQYQSEREVERVGEEFPLYPERGRSSQRRGGFSRDQKLLPHGAMDRVPAATAIGTLRPD